LNEPENASMHSQISEPSVVVRSSGPGYAQDITAGGHHLVADEPVSAGGTNLGLTPYDLILAALGACTSMTVRMYARRKNWALEDVVVRLRHSKIHVDDCATCETKVGILDQIECELELGGSLTPEQRAKLLEISEKCPVHRTLTSEIAIRSSLAYPNSQ
jgi:putative redox protein